jgi:hypothetical protein
VPIRKIVDLKDLRKLRTYIERDTSLLSNGLFDIIDFPEKLTAGKNLFKIRMQNDRFVDNSTVEIEILDFNGNPIYYEPLNYIEKDGTRVIAVYVYPDTSPGVATVYVAGRLANTIEGDSIPFSDDPNSEIFKNVPNILWSRTVPVAPSAPNTSEIIYVRQPGLTITEIIQPYLQPVDIFNVFTEFTGSGSPTYEIKKKPTGNVQTSKQDFGDGSELNFDPNAKDPTAGDKNPGGKIQDPGFEATDPNKADPVQQGQFTTRSPVAQAGKAVATTTANKNQMSTSNPTSTGGKTNIAASSQVVVVSSVSLFESFTDFALTAQMEGGTLTVVNPIVQVEQGAWLNAAGQVLPDSQRVFEGSTQVISANGTTAPLSGSIVFQIIKVISNTTAEVAQMSGFADPLDNTQGAFELLVSKGNLGGAATEAVQNRSQEDGTTSDSVSNAQSAPTTQIVDKILSTSTNITASFIKPVETIFTENSSSFADIIIADTEPATGDVYRIKTLYKPSGFFGDFLDLGDTILEQQDILIDTGSLETNVTVGTFYENFGIFESLQEIQTYWTSGSIKTTSTSFAYDENTLIGGVSVTPDWTHGGSNQYTAALNSSAVFKIKTQHRPLLYANTTYIVRFNVALPPDIGLYSSSDPLITFPRMDVYVNNKITTQNPRRIVSIGQTTLEPNWTSTFTNDPGNYSDTGVYGTRIGTVMGNKNSPSQFISVELQFRCLKTNPLDLNFVIRSGKFIMSDISVLADKQTGFTPGYVRLFKRIPTEHLKTPLTFKFQYYDIAANKAGLETIVFGSVFNGGNQYIDGTDNLITGSVFVGSAIGSGIELAGVSSGFLRSVGYEGFTSASLGKGPGGFMMYSGSNRLQIGDDLLNDVGLELVAKDDRSHFIFRASGSDGLGEVDIKAEKFFIGTTGSQFVSGSSGDIEISSSIFHLDPKNDVLIIGADAVIEADLSANQLFVPAGTTKANARAYISGSGEAGFIGDGTGEYAIILDGRDGGTSVISGLTASSHALSTSTYTISSSTDESDPVSFISSSAFKVSAGGTITGSRFLMSGGRITSGVTIEGSVSANSILTPATIAGAPATEANASSSISALGFAKFVSASIAGFTVNTEEIKSSNNSLRLKSSGQITGSNVLFNGGRIANFDIIGNTLLGKDAGVERIRLDALSGDVQIDGEDAFGITIGGAESEVENSTKPFIVAVQDNGSRTIFRTGDANQFIKFDTGGSPKLFISSSNYFLGGGSQFISGSNGNIEISSSNFHLDNAGNVVMAGKITATEGAIGGWSIASSQLSSISSTGGIKIDSANKQIALRTGSAVDTTIMTFGNLGSDKMGIRGRDPNDRSKILFKLGEDGNIIGGFTITDTKITGNNIIIDSAGSIQTSDYASDLKGWKISAANNGFLEVENAKIRGTLSTAVFEKETVNAVGGQLYVANSTTLTSSIAKPAGNYLPTDTTMSVINVSGFAVDEILSLKKVSPTGFSTEYIRIESASRNDASSETDLSGDIFVIRGYSGSTPQPSSSLGGLASRAQSYSGSQVIVSTGKIGTGFIRLNANPNDPATPYMDIVERTGSAIYDVELKARLGDLSGLANSDLVFGNSDPGFGLATDNVFLQGGITATFGSIGGFGISANTISSSNNNLILRDSGQITGSTVLFSGGEIGGFNLTSTEISSSGLLLKSSGQITGSNVLFSGGKITGEVEFTGQSDGGQVVFFEDFSSFTNGYNGIDLFTGSSQPRIDGSGKGFYTFQNDGLSDSSVQTSAAGQFYGNYLQLGNNSGADEMWLSSNQLIPFNENSLYEIEIRAKVVAADASARFYAGITAFSQSIQPVNISGTTSFSSQHYIAAGYETPSELVDWKIMKGYFQGVASSNNGSEHRTKTDPATLTNKALNGYFAPLIIANFNGEEGQTLVDYVRITEFSAGGGSTRISGDSIKTGNIESTNLSTTVGTKLSLDDGIMQIGGTGAYTSNNGILLDGPAAKFAVGNASGNYVRFNHTSNKLEINTDNFDVNASGDVSMTGTVTANAGTIGGFAITPTAISSSNNKLIMRSDGQITGSNILFSGGKITGGVTIEGSVTANAIRTPATIAGSPSTAANASSSIDSTGFAKFVSASIGGFEILDDRMRAGFVPASSSIKNTTVSASLQIDGGAANTYATVDSFTTNAHGVAFWETYRAAGNQLGLRSTTSTDFQSSTTGGTSGHVSINNIVDTGNLNLDHIDGNGLTGQAIINEEGGFSNRVVTVSTAASPTLLTLVSSSTHLDQAEEAPLVLTAGAQLTASAATFTGDLVAKIVRDRAVTITAANSGSYLLFNNQVGTPPSSYTQAFYNLVLDGSLGGEKIRRVKIACPLKTKDAGGGAGTYVVAIAGVKLPEVSNDASMEATIEISGSGIHFRNDLGPFAAGEIQ